MCDFYRPPVLSQRIVLSPENVAEIQRVNLQKKAPPDAPDDFAEYCRQKDAANAP